jgi:hypothetical protein
VAHHGKLSKVGIQ